MADNKAAFGVFPQMKPRRSQQDREAAKNVPVDLARGFVSGALGMPGDIESLARLPYELITGNESPTILPTSEDIEKRLPFRSDTPVSRAATGLGQIGGGFYTGPLSGARAMTAVPGALMRAGKDFAQAAGQPAVNVIKPKGGNFLTGSVEKALKPLKGPYDTREARDELRQLREQVGDLPRYQEAERIYKNQDALDQWIDRNLTNYVKKEMATPEDPVRRLAEEGVLHSPMEAGRYRVPENVKQARFNAGEPIEGRGQSELAKAWEHISDAAIKPTTVRHTASPEPWMSKVDPDTPLYFPSRNFDTDRLGFDHIVDVLKQDLASGRIRPDQLSKVSMEQAVRRTYEFDQDMAKKMREAQIKATEGMPVHKEYPEGYKWVELTAPKAELQPGHVMGKPSGYPSLHAVMDEATGQSVSIGATPDEALRLYKRQEREKILADALKYEGETMGHCVGGYCPDVLEGHSRIYSLRDAKGEPHVTVEVQPHNPNLESRYAKQNLPDLYAKYSANRNEYFNSWPEFLKKEAPELLDATENKIVQIKGKQNKAPKEEYLPFVQDFVRGGKWSEVGDLGNTGLMRTDAVRAAGWDMGDINQPFLTKQEYDDLLLRQLKPEGMKAGGEVKMAGGGLLKNAAKNAIGKAAEAAGMKAPVVAEKDLTTLQDFHTSLGDRIRAGAEDARKMMEGFDYKYDKGQRVFTKDSAAKNRAPYTVIERTRVGNVPMREDMNDLLSKKVIDPETGKVKRTPYEPGYRVRMEHGPEDTWHEFVIPASAIIGDVGMKRGGKVSISNNADAQMMDVLDKKMAGGGIAKLAKSLTGAKKAEGVAKSTNGPAFGAYGYTDDLLRRERGSFSSVFGVDYGQTLAPSFEFAPVKRLNTTEKVDEAKVRSLMNAMKESGNTLDNRIPPVIVDSAGNVLDGHHRVEAARRLGYEQVPIIEKFDRQSGPKFGDEYAKGGAVRMAGGGLLRKAAQALKAEPSLPLNLPRAPAKTKEEIRPIAQRMAEQMTGEFVRPNPAKSINPAGKSLKQFKMEQDLTHDVRPAEGKTLLPQDVADIEKQLGMLKIGVSGDTTVADKTLYRAGPYELDLPSPQHGGPLYGLGGEGAWASNNPVAATFQKRVQELSQANKDAPVLGQFLAMGPGGSNFAMHFADANLRAINPSKMSKQQVEQFNELIRKGTDKSGPRPGFPGIEDKESAYLHFAFDPELRKHFNDLMQKPDYTSKLGLPDGRVVLHAITEPELRNTEVLTSGLSQMRLDPSVDPKTLAMSAHPTYSHVIPKVPGSNISRTKYPVPAELEFPDVAEFIKHNYRPQDATRVYQTATPRQMVDPQHIDEMKMFEELMKQYTGKKKGGAVKMADGGLIKVTKKRKAKA